MFDQPNSQILAHLAQLLGYAQSKQCHDKDPITISGSVKKNQQYALHDNTANKEKTRKQLRPVKQINWRLEGSITSTVRSFELDAQKLQWAGISFGVYGTSLIQAHLRELTIKQKPLEIRFWGIIRGTEKDYYIIQGRKQPHKSTDSVPVGSQKNGQGANYYTFWVTNSLEQATWTQLPDILPQHIRTARQIKKLFTGNLDHLIESYPQFKAKQRYYLKAQLCRITHALQLAPKGIYKPNDQNPKIIEYEQQVKIPEFAQLNTLEGWVHKNQMILNLGRCTHFVDPKLPEQQIEAKMNQLVEKDPEAQRLKALTQDKVPQELALGVENPWLVRVAGNSQIFTKDDANLIYGVTVLRNIYWPGWTTIGYKNGFTSIYIGNGLKSTQTSLNVYQNPDLQRDAEDAEEYPEPYPKELPKVQPPAQDEPKAQE